MTIDWLAQCSDWNPQLFRELKGRLKRRNIMLAIITSLVMQLLVLLYFWALLPAGHPYWWSAVYQMLGLVMTYGLLFAGVYLLIRDVGKEERRGTLNFIRSSPQTSRSFLLGKLLGVPVMPYLVALLAVPLHLFAAIAAHVPTIAHVLHIYLLTAAACAFFYTSALLYAFLGVVQGWVGVGVIGLSCTIFFQLWHKAFVTIRSGYLGLSYWFHLPVGENFNLGLMFALITLGTSTYWIWEALNRRFRNSNLTLLSKSQSYRMTLCFEIWLLGFFIRDTSVSNYNRPFQDWILGFIFRDVYPNSYQLFTFERPFQDLLLLGFFNLLWFVWLLVALIPQRQMLLDWARYRRERVASVKQFWSFSVVKDLVLGEKSPALVAIALNLLLASAVVIPWVLSWRYDGRSLQNVAIIILGIMHLLICAAIAQLMMMRSPKRAIWAASTIAGVIILPLTILVLLQLNPAHDPLAWLFSIGAFATLHSRISMLTIFIAFLGHLGILVSLALRLSFQLQRAGESEGKALLASKALRG